MYRHFTEHEYYGQNPCIEPAALMALLRAISSRPDYPSSPRYRGSPGETAPPPTQPEAGEVA
jgi:hypothetical protein